MKIKVIIILVFLSIQSFAQRNLFLGFEPSVTVEQYYDKGEFDLNIFPAVMRIPVSKRFDFRFTTISNYHFSKTDNGFSNVGISFALPFSFKKKESLIDKTSGFYIAPLIGGTRNFFALHYATTIALEPGYAFAWESRFAFHLGVQLGKTYFFNDHSPSEWGPHFGFKFHLGWWIFQH
ncbi:MAG: hypothetical protein JXL97_17205 [Bacteroidales bacterium]|nr:hypothetical protein [Bacteroidales bacterium]